MAIYGLESTKEAKRLLKESNAADKRGDKKETAALVRQSLIIDPYASSADWEMLGEGPRIFSVRRRIRDMLRLCLDDMAPAARKYEASFEKDPNWKPKIFVFWAQGFENAPPIVQAAHEQLLKLHEPDEVVSLDMGNVRDWVEFPDYVWSRAEDNLTSFSDLLRAELLATHGGIWIDSTCIPAVRLHDKFEELTAGSGLFAFRKNQPEAISNWFLMAQPGNYNMRLLRDAIHLYWRVFDKSIYYFYFHQIFRFLYKLDPRFHALWNKGTMPRVEVHGLQARMHQALADQSVDELMALNFVHKLTYKVNREKLEPGSIFEAIENRTFFK